MENKLSSLKYTFYPQFVYKVDTNALQSILCGICEMTPTKLRFPPQIVSEISIISIT